MNNQQPTVQIKVSKLKPGMSIRYQEIQRSETDNRQTWRKVTAVVHARAQGYRIAFVELDNGQRATVSLGHCTGSVTVRA